MKKTAKIIVCSTLACIVFSACSSPVSSSSSSYQVKKELLQAENTTLKLTGNTSSFKAMESVISSFHTLYPNCSIEYEYVQDYDKSMLTRLSNNDDVDLFVTNNITADSKYLPYALELSSHSDALSLADTYPGLIHNFTISGDNGGLYAIPFGGEVRGMYVNTTLLNSLGLSVPNNYEELLSCCSTLLENGYIPIQGNPSNFAVMLMYPYFANIIANASSYQETYDKVNNREAGISSLFKDPMAHLYTLVEKSYYNYKTVETDLKFFTDSTEYTAALNFLNIVTDSSGNSTKIDDIGQVAFMPGVMSLKNTLDKTKDNYHSAIEYQFILSPTADDGGFAYLSPSAGIAINKNSTKTAWALEFLNYLFSKDINKSFAQEQNIIPNTADALDIINQTFEIDASHISQLGQVTFDYVFYDVIKKALTDVCKGNNPKYMQTDGTMYSLDHYMDALEKALTAKS